MPKTKAWAAKTGTSPLAPFEIERREPRERDVVIDIAFCGVCHSDIHQVRDEWGGSIFPMVPGHEIVGRVSQVGAAVKKVKAGDYAGVGCMVDSCRRCNPCKADLEQFCEQGAAMTYNGTEMDRRTPTYGGYSARLVVDEAFALKLAPGMDLAATAPLLCAGITTYSPLRQWKVGKGTKVGVVGLGGLGHMGVKLAASMGAEVTMLSTSRKKEQDARRLGAHEFALTSDPSTFKKLANRFDLILNTISAPHDYNAYLGMVKVDGTMVLVGAPPAETPVSAFSLIMGRKKLAGSLIGGIAETQEMLDYCAEKKITAEHRLYADVEIIPISKINEAYDRMVKNDVRYRFSIDCSTIQ
jgi:uncharacterized zinc-type alcohol dehydrogenase-like protein